MDCKTFAGDFQIFPTFRTHLKNMPFEVGGLCPMHNSFITNSVA